MLSHDSSRRKQQMMRVELIHGNDANMMKGRKNSPRLHYDQVRHVVSFHMANRCMQWLATEIGDEDNRIAAYVE